MKRLICWGNMIRLNWRNPFAVPIDGHSYVETFSGIRNGREEQDLECEVCGIKLTIWD